MVCVAPMSTQSLPQYAKPPQAPGPSNSSVSSSPPRQQPNPPPSTLQRTTTGEQKESRLEQLTPAHVATEAVRVVDVRQTLHPSGRPHAQRDVTGGAGDGRVGLVYPEHLETG